MNTYCLVAAIPASTGIFTAVTLTAWTASRAFCKLSLTALRWASEPLAPRAAVSRPDISLANSAAVLAPADPAAWHPEQTAFEPDSMAEVAAWVAWLAWQVVQPESPLAAKI